jgi:hypothetical protein
LKKTLASVFNPGEFSMAATVAVAALLPLFGLVRGLGDFFSTYLIEWVGNRVVMDLRQAMFTHYQALSLGFFGQARTGDVISRTTNDTQLVERAVAVVLSDLAKQPFTLIGLIGFLIWTNWHLAVVSLVVFPVCILPVALFGRKVRRSSREGQQKMADLVSILEENILGVRIVKAFGMEPYEIARFSERCRGVFSRAMKVTRARASVEPIIVLISLLGFSLILVYARWSHMTFDEFFSFGAALVAMYDPVKRLSKVHLNIQQSSAAADRIFEMLDEPILVKEKPDARVFQEPLQAVRFENVSFSYGEGQVLRDISFAAGRGQVVALVGSSGSGKTTLVSLVPAVLRRDGREHPHQRPRRARSDPGLAAPPAGHGDPGDRAVQRHGGPQYFLRRGDGDAGRRGGCGPPRQCPRVYRSAARGLRHGDRGARYAAVRRAAPAPGHRARPAAQSAGPHSGRSHQRAGHRIGETGAGRAGHPDGGPHRAGHRPPPVHRAARRLYPGPGSGPHRGVRHARGIAGPRRAVPSVVRDAIPGSFCNHG